MSEAQGSAFKARSVWRRFISALGSTNKRPRKDTKQLVMWFGVISWIVPVYAEKKKNRKLRHYSRSICLA
jgi:hypothetical protein